jgi:hypothetical protein
MLNEKQDFSRNFDVNGKRNFPLIEMVDSQSWGGADVPALHTLQKKEKQQTEGLF